MKVNKTFFTLIVTSLSVLTALEVVLSRFLSFSVWNQKIGFAFAATAMAGMLFGPIGGAIVGGLADFVGALLFPIGAYFPGFTLTNALLGALFGLFFCTLPRIRMKKQDVRLKDMLEKNVLFLGTWSVLCAVVDLTVCTLLLNTVWISVLYKTPIRELFATRLVQCAIMLPIQVVILPFLFKLSTRLKKEFLK